MLLLAERDGVAAGCAGLRLLPAGVGEVCKVFVAHEQRRRGVARALMARLEQEARRAGLTSLRLDTRRDLTEARRLYADLGWRDVEPFTSGPYAHHWLGKQLG